MEYPDIYLVKFKEGRHEWGDVQSLFVAEFVYDGYYITGSDVEYNKEDFAFIQKVLTKEFLEECSAIETMDLSIAEGVQLDIKWGE